MLLAELEVWHSRSIAPTRRVAIGHRRLPADPAPGFGGLLLGGIVATYAHGLDPDLLDELASLLTDLERGRRVPQPRLRHRFQEDRHGLARTRHRLVVRGETMALHSDGDGTAASQVLAAAYAAGALPAPARSLVITVLRRGLRWRGSDGAALFAHLAARSASRSWSSVAVADPSRWAAELLGLVAGYERREVQVAYRVRLRQAHPDHGGDASVAAVRIADLREARRILLAGT